MCKDPYTCKVGRSGFISIAASGVWFFTALLTSTLKFQADTLYKAPEVEDTCKNSKRTSFRSTVSHLDERSERSTRSRDVEMQQVNRTLNLPDKQRPALDRATSGRSTESTIMTGDGSMSIASAHTPGVRVPRSYSNSSTNSARRPITRNHSMNSKEIAPSSSLSNAKMPARYVDRAHSMNSKDDSVASTRPGRMLASTSQHDRPRSVSRTRQPRNVARTKSADQTAARSAPDNRGELARAKSWDNSLSNLECYHHPGPAAAAAAAAAASTAGQPSRASRPMDRLSRSMHEGPTDRPRSVSRTRQPRNIARSVSADQTASLPEPDERGQVTRAKSWDNSSSNLVSHHHPGAAAGRQPSRASRPMDRLSRSMHEGATDRPRSVSRTRQPSNIARSKSINQTTARPAPEDRGQMTRAKSWDDSSSNLVYHAQHHHHPAAAAAGQPSRASRSPDRLVRSMHERPMPPSLVRPGGRRPNASLERILGAHNARIARSGGVARTNSGISIDTIESFEI